MSKIGSDEKAIIAGKAIAWQNQTALLRLCTYYCSISNIMFEWPHLKFQPTANSQISCEGHAV